MPEVPEKEYVLALVKKYLEGNATEQEINLVQSYYEWFDQQPEILESLSEDHKTALEKMILQQTWKRIEQIESEKQSSIPYYKKSWFYSSAAAILLIIIGGSWYWQSMQKSTTIAGAEQHINDVAPGTSGAVLTLANGKKIILDSTGNGLLFNQSNAGIYKNNDGIAYEINANTNRDIQYNTLSTPVTQTYTITLSDGTKVWLNAGSSITYPVVFNKDERRINITGEVYMEVAKNKSRPFYVRYNQSEIKVLGTSFNINAYAAEPVSKTTLLEGTIQLTWKDKKQLLKPGEQVEENEKEIHLFKNTNTESVIAWKNGYFLFEDVDVDQVMNQLKRWYDVQVEYVSNKPAGHFAGEISRNTNLLTVLEILNKSGIQAKLVNRKIIVNNNN
jgi:transmembrane sensor